ncbi:hypothetical protein LCGC14_2019600 [marine sediment metagenome]|uniref:Uncharacterized protein n=1 Tax=marine sediment metagenome TaxID=412755 RepID=A0A0F9EXZ3_9ZZZZ
MPRETKTQKIRTILDNYAREYTYWQARLEPSKTKQTNASAMSTYLRVKHFILSNEKVQRIPRENQDEDRA